jgi:hypothetical protein
MLSKGASVWILCRNRRRTRNRAVMSALHPHPPRRPVERLRISFKALRELPLPCNGHL